MTASQADRRMSTADDAARSPPSRPAAARRCSRPPRSAPLAVAALGRCQRARAGRRPRALPQRQDQLAAGRGRNDHRRGDPGQLLRQPRHAAAAVRGADRHQGALREGAAGADPAEGDARPVVEDRRPMPRTRPTRCTTRSTSPNKWVEPLDHYLNDAEPHRPGLVQLRRHPQGLARRRLDRRQALRHSVRRRGDGAGLSQGPLRRQGPEAGRHLRRARRQRQGADTTRPTASTASRCAASPAPARTCTSTRRCCAASAAAGCSGKQRRRQLAGGGARAQWYVDTLTSYAPPAVRNWNWPDIADAFSQGTVASYIDAHSSAAVHQQSRRSRRSSARSASRAGPRARAASASTSIWNWGFPINAALTDKAEEGDLALHRLGRLGRDAGAHLVEVRRPGQALRASTACRCGGRRSSPRR